MPPEEEVLDEEEEEDEDESEEEEDNGEVFTVETLLKHRKAKNGNGLEYLVKWKGWSAKHNSWEPEANVLDDSLIQAYNDKKGKGRGKGRQKPVQQEDHHYNEKDEEFVPAKGKTTPKTEKKDKKKIVVPTRRSLRGQDKEEEERAAKADEEKPARTTRTRKSFEKAKTQKTPTDDDAKEKDVIESEEVTTDNTFHVTPEAKKEPMEEKPLEKELEAVAVTTPEVASPLVKTPTISSPTHSFSSQKTPVKSPIIVVQEDSPKPSTSKDITMEVDEQNQSKSPMKETTESSPEEQKQPKSIEKRTKRLKENKKVMKKLKRKKEKRAKTWKSGKETDRRHPTLSPLPDYLEGIELANDNVEMTEEELHEAVIDVLDLSFDDIRKLPLWDRHSELHKWLKRHPSKKWTSPEEPVHSDESDSEIDSTYSSSEEESDDVMSMASVDSFVAALDEGTVDPIGPATIGVHDAIIGQVVLKSNPVPLPFVCGEDVELQAGASRQILQVVPFEQSSESWSREGALPYFEAVSAHGDDETPVFIFSPTVSQP